MWSWAHRPRDLAVGIDTEKQRPRTEGTAQQALNKPELSLTVLKPETLTPVSLCVATRSRKTVNEEQRQTGNLCVWAETCRDTHSLCSAGTPAGYVVVFIHHDLMETTHLWCYTAKH